MRWTNLLAVLLLSYSVIAIPIDAGDVAAVPEAVIEVTVWEDEQWTNPFGWDLASVCNRWQCTHCPSSYPRSRSPRCTTRPRTCHRNQQQSQSKHKTQPYKEDSSLMHRKQTNQLFGISYSTYNVDNTCKSQEQNSAEDVTAAVTDARVYLRTLGYTGPVVTIDTSSKVLEHLELCHVSDYCAANCHAFCDAQQTPENAGSYVAYISRRLSEVSRGKRTFITESGWPHAGQSNGKAVPSKENQQKAIESLRNAFWDNHGDLVLFSAFDDLWKVDNHWTFGAERFWGIEKR